MGGNALKTVGFEPRRVRADEYHGDIVPDLSEAIEEMFLLPRYEIVQAYRLKPDFGDVDVVLCKQDLPDNWREIFVQFVGSRAQVSNGNVLSAEFKGMQVDLIVHDEEFFDWACYYYAWNDLGNLIGRVARSCGFKFAHDGLKYIMRDPDNPSYVIKEITVTNDVEDLPMVFQFLGFSWVDYKIGFDTLEDIYRYVVNSQYFAYSRFDLQNRSRKARVRDQKRPVYNQFLTWLVENGYDGIERAPDKYAKIAEAMAVFDQFAGQYLEADREHVTKKRLKSFFNGHLVMEVSGCVGKNVADIVQHVRDQYDSDEQMLHVYSKNEIQMLHDDEDTKQITKDVRNALNYLEIEPDV